MHLRRSDAFYSDIFVDMMPLVLYSPNSGSVVESQRKEFPLLYLASNDLKSMFCVQLSDLITIRFKLVYFKQSPLQAFIH